jgi:proline iminopeptidase
MLLTSDGAQLWTASGGSGPDVALAHGGPGLWDYLEPLARRLEAHATIHRWDQRGGGRSPARGPFTVDRFVADMESVRAACGADRWVAGGHSWGANLALLYALRHPEHVSGVLYIAGPGVDWPRWRPLHRAEVKRRLGEERWQRLSSGVDEREANRLQWSTDYVSEDVARPHVQRMLDAGFHVNRECNRLLSAEVEDGSKNVFAGVGRFRAPVLVVQGAADPRPVAACDELVERLPIVRRVVLDSAGHFPWVERPDAFADAVVGWLAAFPLRDD